MMNKPEFSFVLGFFISLVNLVALTCTSIVVIRQFKKVITIGENRHLINFHFVLMLTAFAFSFANGLALHRFFEAWIINKSFSTIYLALNGFSDRIFMCIASIGLLIISLLRVPFFIQDD
jgi:hypothetical protein